VREKDGLALSSRNAYLSASERAVAPTLNRVLKECAAALKSGAPIATTLAKARAEIERSGFAVDYLEARHAETLAPISAVTAEPVRLLVAAKLGRTRLIDNIGV
jgi:pantoate--beta-alanine ligase